MSFEKFANELERQVSSILDARVPGCSISRKMVEKLQEGSYLSITVNPPGSNIGVNINVADLYEYYAEEKEIAEIAEQAVASVMQRFDTIPVIDNRLMTDYEYAKKHLIIQLISREANQEMLAHIPHTVVEDMAMVYRIRINAASGCETCLIKDDLLEMYGVSPEQLHKDALENAARIAPLELKNLFSVISEMAATEEVEIPEESPEKFMYYISNKDRVLGAGALFYPGVMDMCANILGGSYYVIPSSIHELLVASARDCADVSSLNEMITEINNTIVQPSERLTNHAYYYDAAKRTFRSA